MWYLNQATKLDYVMCHAGTIASEATRAILHKIANGVFDSFGIQNFCTRHDTRTVTEVTVGTTITNQEVQNLTKHFCSAVTAQRRPKCHSHFLEGGSQTNSSTGRMPTRQVKIL